MCTLANSLPGRVVDATLADRELSHPVLDHQRVYEGRVWDIVTERVDLGHSQVQRDFVDHTGAVAVIAQDDDGRILLLSQYRHPTRRVFWEPPAGLLDVVGEEPVTAAARELAEEADLRAAHWEPLQTFFSSPGGSSEQIQIFLARGLSVIPEAERFVREDEEADMEAVWISLDDALAGVSSGALQCPTTVVGILALAARRS